MKLTQNETNLFRAISIAVFRTYWYNEKVTRGEIIRKAKGINSICSATPIHLEKMVNLYSADLTNEEYHEASLKILEIFLKMKADILGVSLPKQTSPKRFKNSPVSTYRLK